MKKTAPSKTKPLPIRFDGITIGRLKIAARRLGSNSSAVVRFAVIQQLEEIETGKITLREVGNV